MGNPIHQQRWFVSLRQARKANALWEDRQGAQHHDSAVGAAVLLRADEVIIFVSLLALTAQRSRLRCRGLSSELP